MEDTERSIDRTKRNGKNRTDRRSRRVARGIRGRYRDDPGWKNQPRSVKKSGSNIRKVEKMQNR
jgi:hypothetical protein